jgi:hypothetical protein
MLLAFKELLEVCRLLPSIEDILRTSNQQAHSYDVVIILMLCDVSWSFD